MNSLILPALQANQQQQLLILPSASEDSDAKSLGRKKKQNQF